MRSYSDGIRGKLTMGGKSFGAILLEVPIVNLLSRFGLRISLLSSTTATKNEAQLLTFLIGFLNLMLQLSDSLRGSYYAVVLFVMRTFITFGKILSSASIFLN